MPALVPYFFHIFFTHSKVFFQFAEIKINISRQMCITVTDDTLLSAIIQTKYPCTPGMCAFTEERRGFHGSH